MLEIKNVTKEYKIFVTKKYKNKVANDNINLVIEDGEIFGFIGPNGAGKSTLIKSIVGLNNFDSGEIIFNNMTMKNNEMEFKKTLAYIPDNPDLYEHLSGIKYLNFICDVFGVDKNKRVEEIESYATRFGIKDNLNDLISSYSHGMKQKLAVIASLIHHPHLLVMDEPFVGLDPIASHTLKTIMQEFVSEGNIIFFSSHVLEVVEKLCEHVAIINNGKIVYDGNLESMNKDESLEQLFLELTNHE